MQTYENHMFVSWSRDLKCILKSESESFAGPGPPQATCPMAALQIGKKLRYNLPNLISYLTYNMSPRFFSCTLCVWTHVIHALKSA